MRIRTPLFLLPLALACVPPAEDAATTDEAAFFCTPSVTYAASPSVSVGDDVSLRPRIGCSTSARNRRFALVPATSSPLTANHQFDGRLGRGLELNGATGEILGTLEGWSGWQHDDAPARAAHAPIQATVRMCYTPRSFLTPKLGGFQIPSKQAFRFDASGMSYKLGAALLRVSAAKPTYRVQLPTAKAPSASDFVYIIDGLSFIADEEDPQGALQPVPAIADCDEVDPGLPRQVQQTAALECRQAVQRDIDACFGGADVNDCVEDRITARYVQNRRRAWDCLPGERSIDTAIEIALTDDDPLTVVAPYDTTPYTPGRYTTRRVSIGGGAGPYTFTATGLSHALRIRDDGSIAGRLYRWDGIVNATVLVSDTEGRQLRLHFRPITSDAQVLICAGPNLGEPCEALPRRDNESWQESTVLDLNANWRDARFPRSNQISSVLVSQGYDVILCDQAAFDGECRVFSAPNRDTVHELQGTPSDNWAGSVQVRGSHAGAWWGYTNHGASVDDRVTSWSEEAQGITHNDTHWFVTNKWYIFRYPKQARLSSRSWDLRKPLPPSCEHFGDPTWHDGSLYVPVERCAGPNGSAGAPHRSAPNGDDRIYVYDAELNQMRYGVLNHQRQASWVAVDPRTGLIYSSDFNTGSIQVYSGVPAQRAMVPEFTVSLPHYVRGIQGGVISQNGNLYLSTNDTTGDSRRPYASRGILVYELRAGEAVPLRVRGGSAPNWIHPRIPDGAGMEMEGITLYDVRGENIPDVPDGQIHYVILDNDWPSADEIYLKHISVNQPSKL